MRCGPSSQPPWPARSRVGSQRRPPPPQDLAREPRRIPRAPIVQPDGRCRSLDGQSRGDCRAPARVEQMAVRSVSARIALHARPRPEMAREARARRSAGMDLGPSVRRRVYRDGMAFRRCPALKRALISSESGRGKRRRAELTHVTNAPYRRRHLDLFCRRQCALHWRYHEQYQALPDH
jgi:hypothetical protein